MKLDPRKTDYAKLAAALKKLAAYPSKGDLQPRTGKTLKAGKLEDWDLFELVMHEYKTELEGRDDIRRVWDRSRALLAVIAEMEALHLRSEQVAAVRQTLEGWKLDS